MIVPATQSASNKTPATHKRSVRLHAAAVAAWAIFVAFYASALLFFGTSAYSYWILKQSAVDQVLALFRIGIGSPHYRPISVAYGAIAFVYVVKLIQLIVPSIRRRQFTFNGRILPRLPSPRDEIGSKNLCQAATRGLMHVYDAFFGPSGLFGVSGPCFDLLLLVRELLETVLQPIQAYRMSQLLTRAWVNRFYVGLLVLNCWLMPLMHTLFHHTPMTKYFVTLTCDLILDFVSSIVVPFTLIAIYSQDVDPTAPNMFGLKWFEEGWQINAESEFQIILVVSWADLVFRLVFAVGMITNLNTLQRLVSVAIEQSSTTRTSWSKRWSSIIPESRQQEKTRTDSRTIQALRRANGAVSSNPCLTKLMRVVFAAWGVVVLALHTGAEMSRDVLECAMQIRPWGIAQPSCNLVVINCYQAQISGSASDIHNSLDELYPLAVTTVVVRHCPALEVPTIIQSFNQLKMFKIYNSSIAQWDSSAALTKTNHPEFSIIMLVRVRTLDGKIPVGLQAPDFPPKLNIFGFPDTNVREIPDDLDTKWMPGAEIHFDTAQLTEIPDVLLRLAPNVLELAGNPLTEVPKEVFELPTLHFLDLSYTQFSALPDGIAIGSTRLTSFNLDGTNVSLFPAWVDEWLKRPGDVLYPQRISAAGSPYCAERDRIFAGELTLFTGSSSASASILMDASTANWELIKRTVACTPSAMHRYPIFLDDMFGAIR